MTDGILDPSPSRRWIATRPARAGIQTGKTGLRKTSVTRELPVGDAGHAPSAFARPSTEGRPDNSSLHDVNAGKGRRKIRKQKSAAGTNSRFSPLSSGF